MSVCLETTNVLASSSAVGTAPPSSLSTSPSSSSSENSQSTVISTIVSQATVSTNIIQGPIVTDAVQTNDEKPLESAIQPQIPSKSLAKLVVASHSASNNCAVLQKVVTPPLITVINPSGPLTVVKTLCVTSGVSSAPQFTLVNSSPLNVTNAVGKSPTITLLNAPVTVVKAITHSSPVEKNVSADASGNGGPVVTNAIATTTIIENRGHNVFVKNTCPDTTMPDIPQSHKLLTANNFSQSNVFTNLNQQQAPKTVNGQRSKLKILSNIVVPGPSHPSNNILLSKNGSVPSQQRYIPKQKIVSPNGASAKYLNKAQPNNLIKTTTVNSSTVKLMQEKSSLYPTHKSQIKTLLPTNSYIQKPQHLGGIKTISPQSKAIPAGQVQRTGLGLRTIPPQRQQKLPNKPNYIGKHAVQAQKMRQPHTKVKGMKVSPMVPYNVHAPSMSDNKMTELTFNQALTAQIIETLSSTSTPAPNQRNEMLPMRYNNAFSCPEPKTPIESSKVLEDKSKLDALSLICQAVLLDHNYNATLPPDSPTRPSPPMNITSPVNGMSPVSVYSPGSGKRRSLPIPNIISSTSNLSTTSSTPSQNSLITTQEDDAASDISDGSERKHDTEGEETDTAPEAEAVNNDNFDGGYGDYVTRCICGYLHDDGYMVECDRCKVWQHVQCVVKNRQIPDEYLCEVCDPTKPIDRQKARLIQQQWLRDRQFLDPKLRKDSKLKEVFRPKAEAVSDTDSSDGEQTVHNNNVTKGRGVNSRRKSESQQKQNVARQKRENTKESTQKRQKRRERKIVRKKVARTKTPVKTPSEDENQDTWASHLPQLRQWIEKYEEAVTNHYSPELRARISSIRVNGAHSDLNTQFDPTVNKCRIQNHPLTELKFLICTEKLHPNTPIIELRGKYMLSTQHRNSGGSLTTRQHSQRPGPFLFFYRLHKDNTEVCVDTRTYGNAARFVRRSCKPNSELRHCIEKGVLHLYVVAIVGIEKGVELTIKHESHDLAAIGTTQIACACGSTQECMVNNGSTVKKNGEVNEVHNRKRRGRRTISSSLPEPEPVTKPVEVEPPAPPSVPLSSSPTPITSPTEEKPEVKLEPVETIPDGIKEETPDGEPSLVQEEATKDLKEEEKEKEADVMEPVDVKVEIKKEEEIKSPPPAAPVSVKRTSHKSDREEEKCNVEVKEEKPKCKKLSREERKLEAILKAIEQMEKTELRKQEHQAKQAHRRESEPSPNLKEEEKQEPKLKRRRRKGRARTVSQSTSRRNRLNSTDSYITSGDENLLSPTTDSNQSSSKKETEQNNDSRAVGLLLALSNGGEKQHEKSPPREIDSNSNSDHSSPVTPLSSACLLVQAAVEPLESGFKFPKTKKGLMNEWLNKVPDALQNNSVSPTSMGSSSDVDVGGYYQGGQSKNLAALAQAATYCDSGLNVQPRGSAKKRWLRQAISEDHSCDSPSRPDSPPLNDMVAPPKKRKLPRESLSSDNSPPTTPNSAPICISKSEDGMVEIYSSMGGESQMESDVILKERAAKMKQEFCMASSSQNEVPHIGRLLDPRLNREGGMFSNTDLIGTVEKTLSILGLDNTKPEPEIPKKKVKLSISEYRQRKMLNFNDKMEEPEPMEQEQMSTEENNSVDSFKAVPRVRTTSMSSSTSLTSSDDEFNLSEMPVKAPVFNSEPTELERQRETSSLRLKKAFGLSVEQTRPTLDVDTLLGMELEPKVKPLALPSPTFPIPGSDLSQRVKEESLPSPPKSSPEAPEEEREEELPKEGPPSTVKEENSHLYTPEHEDESHQRQRGLVFEETESISYVPPFNNPIYPNDSFATYTSTIDDDARYEGRNPSPPPNL